MSQGLDGVVVAETHISGIDGERGRLWIRGWDVEDLARRTGFEGALALLWEGELPDAESEAHWRVRLGRARVRAARTLERCRAALDTDDAMEALRATDRAPRGHALDDEDGTRIDFFVIATASPSPSASWAARRRRARRRSGAGSGGDSHAADSAPHARRTKTPHPAQVRARWIATWVDSRRARHERLDLHRARRRVDAGSDHGVGPWSRHSARLKGPLHGGAPGPVLDMLDAIGDAGTRRGLAPGRARRRPADHGHSGHRIYRVRDPRAAVLEAAVADLESAGRREPLPARSAPFASRSSAVASAGGEATRTARSPTNVEFYDGGPAGCGRACHARSLHPGLRRWRGSPAGSPTMP